MPSELKFKKSKVATAASQLPPAVETVKPRLMVESHSAFDKLPAGGFIRQEQLIGRCHVSASTALTNRKKHAEAAKNGKQLRTPVREREEVTGILPFSSATLWRKVRAGQFPAPCKLSTRITAWKIGDIRQWLEAQAQD